MMEKFMSLPKKCTSELTKQHKKITLIKFDKKKFTFLMKKFTTFIKNMPKSSYEVIQRTKVNSMKSLHVFAPRCILLIALFSALELCYRNHLGVFNLCQQKTQAL